MHVFGVVRKIDTTSLEIFYFYAVVVNWSGINALFFCTYVSTLTGGEKCQTNHSLI